MTSRRAKVSAEAVLVVNGWTLYAHPLFLDQLETLAQSVERLRDKAPAHYAQKNPSKRLAAITSLIFDQIPQDPTRPEYRQGSVLGPKFRHWFRAKFFQQFRLFFRYHQESRIIVCGWVNDEDTKRVYESNDDAYRVFRQMLQRGRPPDDWRQLLEESKGQADRLGQSRKRS